MAEPDELDEGLAADLCAMVEALQRRWALLAEDLLHDSVFQHIDEAIRQLKQAAGKLTNRG